MIQTGITSVTNVGNAKNLPGVEASNATEIARQAKEFEGVFMSLLVKEMRKTVGEGGLLGSESTDSLGGLFDMYLGNSLAESQPLGIASLWVDQYRQASNS
jgi:Rod binding domain-containing protein